MKPLITKYDEAVARHRSVLCLGLDPDPASHPSTDEKLRFCLRMVDIVSKHVSAVKVNENFVRDFSITEHRKLTEAIHSHGLITIYDCKMNDIENTVRAGITQVSKMGYDFITFNPVMGTLAAAVKHGETHQVGVIVLLHPSNPESEKYFRTQLANGKKFYEKILEETVAANADGAVVGLHPKITGEEVIQIRSKLGEDKIILFPGVGAQGGDLETAVLNGGRRILVNVGRTIIYSPEPEQTASEINSRINELRHVHTGKNI
ncbi:MAG: orotidine-5'-phosphate decarboxylase [Candidatus Caldarchaeum sp.]|nr:orotidine-5'-phosphate decarboxylase [Candidatus Caldarchaeum sp.]MCX8200891.1 orotidine-5'-phosphate decarboxylase [Candidatus Caldarchaeum sp.]MDW8063648.1 orotidine-5'-phosphate decarboxylase [Candidatus Caldarchaeum sp.]MDW8435797.1 orotidine-5'-phosphate decarboxylase [Candidatus Caldarchaeum sp.]